jgi:branched-chain amino acid transport system substrate-binding protein
MGNTEVIRSRNVLSIATIAIAALLSSACASTAPAVEESAPAATEEASAEPIRIGISLPVTGDFSQPGGAAKLGYEAWAENVNNAGGLLDRPVELVILDDASSQEQAVTDYTRLINEEKVDLILGTFSSLLNYPASAVAENNEMVLVAPAGGSPKIFEQEFFYYFFAQQATAPNQANPFVEMIAALPEDQKPKTAAYAIQDDPLPLPLSNRCRHSLRLWVSRPSTPRCIPRRRPTFSPSPAQLLLQLLT